MDESKQLILVLKEIMIVFALIASVGALFHSKFLLAAANLAIMLFLLNEQKLKKRLRKWLRHP